MAFGNSTDFFLNMKLKDDISKGLGGIGKSVTKLGDSMTKAGKKMTMGLTLPLVGLGALALKTAIDFESGFAGVIKTTDGLADSMGILTAEGEKMKQGFRDLAKEVPVAFEELTAIGELGGQLGIAKDGLLDFTKTIAAMGVATNLTTEAAATGFAQIANIMGTPQESIERMGSSIVSLGNNFATTEADILNFAQRISGAGKIAGLTEPQVFAIGAAFSSVGVQAEAGGTAVQKVLLKMTSAVATGGEDLEALGKAMGMTGEEFKQAFEEDAAGAFTTFVETLGEQGDAAINTLSDLGLQDQRLIRSFLSLAGAGDLLNDTLENSQTAWDENIALSDEAEARYRTTASQLTIMKNTFKDVGATIGDVMLPMVNDLLERLKPFIDRMSELDPKVIQVGLAIAGVVAVAGPLLMVLGTLVSVGGTLIGVVLSPLALVIGAVVLALAGLKLAYDNNILGFKEFMDGIIANLPTLEDLKAMFETVVEKVGNIISAFQDAGIASIEMHEVLDDIFGEEIADKIQMIIEKFQTFGEWINNVVELIGPLIGAIEDAGLVSIETGEVLEAMFGTKAKEMIMAFAQIMEDAWSVISSVIEVAWSIIEPALTQFWEGLKAGFESAGPLIEAFQKLWTALGPFFTAILGLIAGIIATVLGVVVSLFAGIANAIQPFIEMIIAVVTNIITIFTGIVQIVTNVLKLIWGLITNNNEMITDAIEGLKTGILNIWTGLKNGVIALVTGLVETAVALVSGFVESIVKWFTDLYDKIVGRSIISDLVDGVVNAITSMKDDALKLVEELVGRFLEWVQGLYDDALEIAKDFIEIGTNIVEGIREGITNAWKSFKSWLKGLWSNLPSWLKEVLKMRSPSQVFAEIGEGIVKGLEKGIKSEMPIIEDVMNDLGAMLVFTLDTYRDEFSMAGRALAGMIARGFGDGSISVVETVKGLVINITDELKAALEDMGISLDYALDNIADFWKDANKVFNDPTQFGGPPWFAPPAPPPPPVQPKWYTQSELKQMVLDWQDTGALSPDVLAAIQADPKVLDQVRSWFRQQGLGEPFGPYGSPWGKTAPGATVYNVYPTYGEYTNEATLSQDIKMLEALSG